MSCARLSFSYPKEMKEKIIEIGKKDRRCLSQMIQIFIEEGIERRMQEEPKKKLKRKSN